MDAKVKSVGIKSYPLELAEKMEWALNQLVEVKDEDMLFFLRIAVCGILKEIHG